MTLPSFKYQKWENDSTNCTIILKIINILSLGSKKPCSG